MTCHSQQLCESLKMQNNKACYNRMRRKILSLAAKHLDHGVPCSLQQKARKALKDELIERWPDFFGDEDGGCALKRAFAYIQQTHAAARSRAKCKPPILPKVPKKSTAAVVAPLKQEAHPGPDTPSTASTQISLAERMTRNLKLYSSQLPASSQANASSATTSTTVTPLPTRVNKQQTPQLSQSFGEAIASSSYRTSSQASPSQSSPFDSRQQMVVGRSMPSPMAHAAHHAVNVQAIHQFLRSCLPPMDHFLQRFINAGLRTEEGLLGASRWRRELIESFLDQLPPHADGAPVLLMEKIVLMHQFATYFL